MPLPICKHARMRAWLPEYLRRIYVRAARTSPERNRVCSTEGKHRTAANNPNLALIQLSPDLKRVCHNPEPESCCVLFSQRDASLASYLKTPPVA
jgi:hypothetical protein